jgi:hypothetical protein
MYLNWKVDIEFSMHDAFLEYPERMIIIVKWLNLT